MFTIKILTSVLCFTSIFIQPWSFFRKCIFDHLFTYINSISPRVKHLHWLKARESFPDFESREVLLWQIIGDFPLYLARFPISFLGKTFCCCTLPYFITQRSFPLKAVMWKCNRGIKNYYSLRGLTKCEQFSSLDVRGWLEIFDTCYVSTANPNANFARKVFFVKSGAALRWRERRAPDQRRIRTRYVYVSSIKRLICTYNVALIKWTGTLCHKNLCDKHLSLALTPVSDEF